jgi:hypothetical protein
VEARAIVGMAVAAGEPGLRCGRSTPVAHGSRLVLAQIVQDCHIPRPLERREMSTRTDVVRDSHRVANAGGDAASWFNQYAIEDCVFYAPSVGIDARGRDAVAAAVQDLFVERHPQYRLKAEPVEIGSFVVDLVEVETGGRSVDVCQLWRFEGDKVAGHWGVVDR